MPEPQPSDPKTSDPARVPPLPTAGQPYRPVLRRAYPKPPGLWHRIALLILRPDQWAQAARYPFHVTFVPLLVVLFLSAVVIGVSIGGQTIPAIRAFSATYDKHYSPLVYDNGKLRVEEVAGKELPRFTVNEVPFVVDPTGKTTADSLNSERAIVLGPENLTIRSSETIATNLPVRDLFESLGSGNNMRIDSANLQAWLAHNGLLVAITVGASLGLFHLGTNFLWAIAVAFLAMPIVLLGAPNLAMPRRVAYRIALAVTIPIIALDSVMQALGIGVSQVIGIENTPILWFTAVAALAFWAGLISSRLYTVRRVKRPGA